MQATTPLKEVLYSIPRHYAKLCCLSVCDGHSYIPSDLDAINFEVD